MTFDLDYENWVGECRTDPDDGNTFVLRSVGYAQVFSTVQRPIVRVNDILGGHDRTVLLDEWLSWDVLAPEEA